MNKLDRRFLDVGIYVKGIRNEPDANPIAGDQYIVSNSYAGAFYNAAEVGQIARYDGQHWIFTTPSNNAMVYDGSASKFLRCRYDQNGSYSWYVEESDEAGHVYAALFCEIGATNSPSPNTPCEKGSRFLDYGNGKYYSCENVNVSTGMGVWSNPQDHRTDGVYYVDINSSYVYRDTGSGLENIDLSDMPLICLFADIETGELRLYYGSDTSYDSYDHFEKIYPFDDKGEIYTEAHTVTAEEVSNAGFELIYSVMDGKETNILCFVQGLAQVAGTAFEVSGNALSWSGKTLFGHVSEGDVFIVQYIKSELES